MNLRALKLLYPDILLEGLEINESPCRQLKQLLGDKNVFCGSMFDYPASTKEKVELSVIKGVLIHINPEMLNIVYQKLFDSSKSYILIAEYYNPTPVSISYRGHNDKLFKRDFAGEFLNKFSDTTLIDYGFIYKGDPAFPQDDITWFLIEKL